LFPFFVKRSLPEEREKGFRRGFQRVHNKERSPFGSAKINMSKKRVFTCDKLQRQTVLQGS